MDTRIHREEEVSGADVAVLAIGHSDDGVGCGRSHQTLNVGSSEVLCDVGQLRDVHVVRQQVVAHQVGHVDVQDLHPLILVGQTNLHLEK